MQKNLLVINLNKKHGVKIGKKCFMCHIGKGRINNVAKKVEGDNSTPSGKWYLESVYYRPDRV